MNNSFSFSQDVGNPHLLAIHNNSVFSLGDNYSGQLGNNSNNSTLEFIELSSVLSNPISVLTGKQTSYVLTRDGRFGFVVAILMANWV